MINKSKNLASNANEKKNKTLLHRKWYIKENEGRRGKSLKKNSSINTYTLTLTGMERSKKRRRTNRSNGNVKCI